MPEKEIEQSEFNSAIAYLNRINTILSACDDASIRLDIVQWFQMIQALTRELSTYLHESEIKERENKSRELFTKINLFQTKQGSRGKQIPQEIYWELNAYEIFLRKIADKHGLLTKRLDPAGKALR